jgi:hypothetical protein
VIQEVLLGSQELIFGGGPVQLVNHLRVARDDDPGGTALRLRPVYRLQDDPRKLLRLVHDHPPSNLRHQGRRAPSGASPEAGRPAPSDPVAELWLALGYRPRLSMIRHLRASTSTSISHSNTTVATPKAKKTTKMLAIDRIAAPSAGTIPPS